MAVIALTVAGDEPSVVTSNEAFNLRGNRDGTAILIRNGDSAQLEKQTDDSNTSYDLRIGEKFRDHRNQQGQELQLGDAIHLLTGNAVIIETEEWVEFPKTRFGQILPKVSLLQKGIANTPSKVDPGYRGRLLITAFNHGKQTVPLRRGEAFCSLHVFDVVGPVRPYNKLDKRISGAPQGTGPWHELRDWIEANVPTVTFIQTAFTLLTLVLAVIALTLR